MNKNLPQKADKKSSALAKPSSLAVRPLNPQEVRLRPAPVWSRALAWTIIGSASLPLSLLVLPRLTRWSWLLVNFSLSAPNGR